MAVTLNKSYLSLQRGTMYQLTADVPVTWSTSNPNVRVSQNGVVYANRVDKLRPDGQATITATADDESTATCKVTIVNWTANKYNIVTKEVITLGTWTANDRNNDFYYTNATGLYRMKDNINFGKPPTYPHAEAFIDTPFGYFYRNRDCSIYRSFDLANWELIFTPVNPYFDKDSLKNSFSWKYDETAGKGYLFIGEYSQDMDWRHKVYRVTINADNTYTSDIVLEFYSRNEYRADATKMPACEHIHAVQVDEYTGNVYVCVGDSADYAGWYYSVDNGQEWNVFAIGDKEKYRSLAMWFTANYIYWSMDSTYPQHIFRIKRTEIIDISKRETVAKLDNGSMWYHLWAKDTNGNDVLLLSQAPEGEIRDWQARVYGIWEMPDGLNNVHELLCVPSSTPDVYSRFAQLTPVHYIDGYIYLGTRDILPSGTWRTELVETPFDNKALVREMYRHFKTKFAVS